MLSDEGWRLCGIELLIGSSEYQVNDLKPNENSSNFLELSSSHGQLPLFWLEDLMSNCGRPLMLGIPALFGMIRHYSLTKSIMTFIIFFYYIFGWPVLWALALGLWGDLRSLYQSAGKQDALHETRLTSWLGYACASRNSTSSIARATQMRRPAQQSSTMPCITTNISAPCQPRILLGSTTTSSHQGTVVGNINLQNKETSSIKLILTTCVSLNVGW